MYNAANFDARDRAISERIRKKLLEAEEIIMQLPAGRSRSLAITHLEDAMLRANVAIADAVTLREGA